MNLINLNPLGDSRGDLVSLEALKNVPFQIKRIYYLTNLDKEHPRGFHAHKKLKQLMICIHGSCDLILDDGITRETLHLNNPFQGVLIENLKWREMHNFSPDCVLVVLADEFYDEEDYIRDYNVFKSMVKK